MVSPPSYAFVCLPGDTEHTHDDTRRLSSSSSSFLENSSLGTSGEGEEGRGSSSQEVLPFFFPSSVI